MIPSVLAQQVRQGVEDFLRTTFPTSTPYFAGMMDRFLERDHELFQGPYLSLRLPFRLGKGNRDQFAGIPLAFTPYLHQERAFDRLSGVSPQSTLIATGTGSGKTECFLYPVLDYCLQHHEERGIKAILVYPMNALATDQAGRIARLIYDTPALNGKITAGLYVGQQDEHPATIMSRDSVITDKDVIRRSPPDILLTNYKMLDYLLIRPSDRELWQQNQAETLKYLVVDELHTFDGAQGTDLACLIRRLKARLSIPSGYFCCVGTSATLGDKESMDDLTSYASQLFGELIGNDAVVSEDRITAMEFLNNSLITSMTIPSPDDASRLDPQQYEESVSYIRAQVELWLGLQVSDAEMADDEWKVRLGEELKGQALFQNLIRQVDSRIENYEDLLKYMDRLLPRSRDATSTYRENLLVSLLSLIATARVWQEETTEDIIKREAKGAKRQLRPFLQLQVNFWLREMTRMVAMIASVPESQDQPSRPELDFSDDLKPELLRQSLPIVHCRECWAMGWVTLKKNDGEDDSVVLDDLKTFYNYFFAKHPEICFLFPDVENDRVLGREKMLCGRCLKLFEKQNGRDRCPDCASTDLIAVFEPDMRETDEAGRVHITENCPFCRGKKSLTILGYRSAGLSSVMISQIFASQYNDDKKMLTFSDSVQDASHRAGFFGARTYRFNLRTAIQKFVQGGGSGRRLNDFTDNFVSYWRNQMGDEKFVTTFLPPDKIWFNDYQAMLREKALPAESALPEDVARRLVWEIHMEYGLNAGIGRTLEKSGCSVLSADRERLMTVIEVIRTRLQNEVEVLRSLTEAEAIRFISGIWVRLKSNGAIDHPMLDAYIGSSGNAWHLGNTHAYLPEVGPQTRTPTFFSEYIARRKNNFDTLHQARGSTWYERWYYKCLTPYSALSGAVIDDVFSIVLGELSAAGILKVHEVRNKKVWGLNPDRLTVQSLVIQFRCQKCGHVMALAEDMKDLWEGAPCFRTTCLGQYAYDEGLSKRANYYGQLYSSGQVHRVFADEHTGLLKRAKREEVERNFKAETGDRKPWYPNLLSCTPTLEMGIDIGDLSSLILCSVPPGQAQYTQRIGRAGRRDGNSFHATVANSKKHDLHFFDRPLEMMQGGVTTPGIFLNASAVLSRQLTAYCLDHWVDTGIAATAMPRELGRVLAGWRNKNEGLFPLNFLSYIYTHRDELFAGFIGLFPDEIDVATTNRLKTFLFGDAGTEDLRYRIAERLEEIAKEIDSLGRKARKLTERIRVNQTKPRDQETEDALRELQMEKKAVQKIHEELKGKDTLNFFTDEGLLPNYAFPEAGVTLRSIIWRRREKVTDGANKFDTVIYDYERGAGTAMRELAPASTFYAGGRKVVVDRIDLGVSGTESWRFCPDCSHAAQEGVGQVAGACPRCGDIRWPDNGQLRQLVKLRQVYANTSDKDSYISDTSDNRETTFFNQAFIVEINPGEIEDSFALVGSDVSFGYEYVQKATLREINMGLAEDHSGNFEFAGRVYTSHGFEVCRHCGKVKLPRKEIEHLPSCTARDPQADRNFTEFLCLYREMTSEAIRVLLPVLNWGDSQSSLQSIVAAIQLGLRKVFKGSIDHLRTTVQEEPVQGATYRKQYLIIYDTVPGGTGYLKQLMQADTSLLRVLDASMQVLINCSCKDDPERDGCYRCLYNYGSSSQMNSISRRTAIELLSRILQDADKLQQIENLGHVQMNPLFDSELERRFMATLQKYHWNGASVQVKKDIINGKPGYVLIVDDRIWYIEPQVILGEMDGVSVPSKPDFVIRPARASDRGLLPIAVFTDGYAFHNKRIGQDMAQRMAIRASGRYLVWSLSYKDVEHHYGNGQGDFYFDGLKPEQFSNGSILQPAWQKFFSLSFSRLENQDSFTWLARYLRDPDEKKWKRAALAYGLASLDPQCPEEHKMAWKQNVADLLPICADEMELPEAQFFGVTEFKMDEGGVPCRMYTAAVPEAISQGYVEGFFVALLMDDEGKPLGPSHERTWNGFLRLYNLFQFLPRSLAITSSGTVTHAFDGVQFRLHPEAVDIGAVESEWVEVFGLVDSSARKFAGLLHKNGLAIPGVGIEISEEGRIIAQAELCWQTERIAVIADEWIEETKSLQEQGWKIFALSDVVDLNEIPVELLNNLKGA